MLGTNFKEISIRGYLHQVARNLCTPLYMLRKNVNAPNRVRNYSATNLIYVPGVLRDSINTRRLQFSFLKRIMSTDFLQ